MASIAFRTTARTLLAGSRTRTPSFLTRACSSRTAASAAAATIVRRHGQTSIWANSNTTPLLTGPNPSRLYSTSTPEPQYSISDLPDDDYHNISDACMDRMVEYFEDIGDAHEIPGYDVEYQSGVMTLKLGVKGTYVVNKQPPNKQLWLSSPTSGPKRYDYDLVHKTWFYNRDHHSLKYLLDTEITKALGFEIDVPLDGIDN
ncbi:frataxin [Entomortierella parvispora]|uniref:ferroxidase n=1 Tax=Entomortierella parvispora TaxID=205924 RepID=A0A9P3LVA9_9FUNG|nr:frataxin [Entomortierella parvispora]